MEQQEISFELPGQYRIQYKIFADEHLNKQEPTRKCRLFLKVY